MTFSQKLGLGLPPLFLRLVLGLIFLWAAVPALLMTRDFEGRAAERLVELGLAGSEFAAPAPESEAPPVDTQPPAEPPAAPPAEEPDDEPQASAADAAFTLIPAQDAPAVDGPLVVTRPRLYGLVLLMDRLAQPNGEGQRMWHEALAEPRILEILAWSAKITELAGGLCILLGLFTRLFALSFVGIMGVALWTTQIAPSIIGKFPLLGPTNLITAEHPALFEFLPPPYFSDAAMATSVWQTMLFQLIILAASAALIFTGAGWLSLDRAIFKRRQPKKAANKGDTGAGG